MRSPSELTASQHSPSSPPQRVRTSRFVEEIDGDNLGMLPSSLSLEKSGNDTFPARRPQCVRFMSKSDVYELDPSSEIDDGDDDNGDSVPSPAERSGKQITTKHNVSLKPGAETSPKVVVADRLYPPRYLIWTLLTIAILASLHNLPVFRDPVHKVGVHGNPVGRNTAQRRQDATNGYCTRWSQQTALVNGTLYSYGGRSSQSEGQQDNTWNNDFLTLDLTKNWNIGSPTLNNLPQPSGPPPVANGYLWHSYTALFLYGGEYSDTPVHYPSPFALWEYDISSSSWKEHSSPQTSPGNNSDGGNQPVQPSAEGAGISLPELGRGWYFGGHEDWLTTAGWSDQIARVYLKSMVEYTFPGYTNNGVQGLANTPAGSDGAWRNITQGGLQTSDGFTERADGVLVYIPGYGPQGVILGLAGGTNTTFTEMNVIDVYDIASSSWYKQDTRGGPPQIRVNPCAVAASAPDGSSTNVYMYGGQSLQPYKSQTQYGDMWILTVPSFTWIQVDDSNGGCRRCTRGNLFLP